MSKELGLLNPRSKNFFSFIKAEGLLFSNVEKHRDYYYKYIRTLNGTELGKEFLAAREYNQVWKMKEIQNLIKYDYERV